MRDIYLRFTKKLDSIQWLCLMLLRLVLAFGFYGAAVEKIKNFSTVVKWFESLDIPLATLMTILVIVIEMAGVFALMLGLFTRIASIPLMGIMCVAIFSVHWKYGFSATNRGFEIPLYYLCMLFTLFAFGPGRLSLDTWIKKKYLT